MALKFLGKSRNTVMAVCTASECAARSSSVSIALWTRVVRTTHGSGVVGVFSDLMELIEQILLVIFDRIVQLVILAVQFRYTM